MKYNKPWDHVQLPKSYNRIGCRRVFKIKHNSNGNTEWYKVRLVAKGYTQKWIIDCKEKFSPISKKDSLRIVLTLIVHYDLKLYQMDVKSVFIKGDLEEKFYGPTIGFKN